MNVLLVGEFSSLHKFLKQGLNQIDNTKSEIIANGDGWKQIGGQDYKLFSYENNRVIRIVSSFKNIRDLKQYDVIQLINPNIYGEYYNRFALRYLLSKGKVVSLVAAGADLASVNAYLNKCFVYNVFDQDKSLVLQYKSKTIRAHMRSATDEWVVNRSNVIIPSSYTYLMGYIQNPKTTGVIPFPINTDEIRYQDFNINNKITFFHGLNREALKGTKYIRGALERLKNAYPNDVEIVIDGHMPISKYVEVMGKTNVVLDQCCSYGYGMNACIAMAQGKIVMSGCREETKKALGVDQCPVIHIEPNEDQIYKQLLRVLDSKHELLNMSLQSRKYIETVHHYRSVAQKYKAVWEDALNDYAKQSR